MSHLSLVSMAEVMVSRAASVSEMRRQLRPSSATETRLWAASTSRHGLRGPQGQHTERRHRNLSRKMLTSRRICGQLLWLSL